MKPISVRTHIQAFEVSRVVLSCPRASRLHETSIGRQRESAHRQTVFKVPWLRGKTFCTFTVNQTFIVADYYKPVTRLRGAILERYELATYNSPFPAELLIVQSRTSGGSSQILAAFLEHGPPFLNHNPEVARIPTAVRLT